MPQDFRDDLPPLTIVDDAVSPEELARWQSVVLRLTQESTGLDEPDVLGELRDLVRSHVGADIELFKCLLFAIDASSATEMHRDVGEYCVLFYPFTNAVAPLRVDLPDRDYIDVKANRLVLFPCTHITHQQVVPTDGSTRYSVAWKFNGRVP